jgi:hypothetical protein
MLVAVKKFTKSIDPAQVSTQDAMAAVNFINLIVFALDYPTTSSRIMAPISHQKSSALTAKS